MRIIYMGSLEWGSTSLQRAQALSEKVDGFYRVDHRQLIPDYVKRNRRQRAEVRMAWPPLVKKMGSLLKNSVEEQSPDYVWVDQGVLVSAETLREIKSSFPSCRLVHYTPDSIRAPGMRLLRSALPQYDLCITTKHREVELYRSIGVNRAIFSWQGYDDAIHRPMELTGSQSDLYRSDLVFIGQNMPKRAAYISRIAGETDFKIGLYGRGWNTGPAGNTLRRLDRGWLQGRDYARAISGARIALCFLNDQVDDDYTTRTFEIPACGTMMLAERTKAHEQLFDADREAAFFDSSSECLEKIQYYMLHDDERKAIAIAGRKKVRSAGCTWGDRMTECLNAMQGL